jgi:ParB family chromosome partitioning protein
MEPHVNQRRPALGKGLSALIPEAPEPQSRGGPLEVDTDQLSPNERQPRANVEDANLDELAASIRARGLIQPILVRRDGGSYRIIAGERRWRAAQRAGLLKVPVIVRDLPEHADRELLELALVENIQRENLNPVDEAGAYHQLLTEFRLTQEQVAAAVGKDRATVANLLRLLRLPEEIIGALRSGVLSAGHGRALLALQDEAAQRQAARTVISAALSVRETEALVKRLVAPQRPRKASGTPGATDVHTRAAEDRIRFALGTKARIVRRGAGGTIEIDFASESELNRLYEYLTAPQRQDPQPA